MRYIVVWANRPDYHPGKDFMSLEVDGHFGSHYWIRDYEKAASEQLDLNPIPASLYTRPACCNDDAEVSARWGGCVVTARNLKQLQVIVAGLRWDEGPTAAGAGAQIPG